MITKRRIPTLSDSDIARFWKYVDKSGACWRWTSWIDPMGYGSLTIKYQHFGAHRISYLINNNIDPFGFFICHSCNNKWCVNPAHLWLGDHKANAIDAVQSGATPCGTGRYNAKLTDDVVREIRKLRQEGQPLKAIAQIYNVHLSLIHLVATRKAWAHVD
jgi:hypothetical protein